MSDTTENLGITLLEIKDRAHDPRPSTRQIEFLKSLDDAFTAIDTAVGGETGAAFSASMASDWTTSEPTTVGDALNRLASAVAAMSGSSIP